MHARPPSWTDRPGADFSPYNYLLPGTSDHNQGVSTACLPWSWLLIMSHVLQAVSSELCMLSHPLTLLSAVGFREVSVDVSSAACLNTSHGRHLMQQQHWSLGLDLIIIDDPWYPLGQCDPPMAGPGHCFFQKPHAVLPLEGRTVWDFPQQLHVHALPQNPMSCEEWT